MNTQHSRPGALHFSLSAREAVAAGDPFDWLYRGEFRRRSDDRDLLAALLHAEDLEDEYTRFTAGGVGAARRLGLLPPTGDTPPEWQLTQAVRELNELGWLADAGGCATPEALRGVLLGAAPLVSNEARAREEAMFSEDDC